MKETSAMKANNTPPDLMHVLARRKITFERWCDEHGIKTHADFIYVAQAIEDSGEYLISNELKALGASLPPHPTVAVLSTPASPKAPTLPEAPALSGAPALSETPVGSEPLAEEEESSGELPVKRNSKAAKKQTGTQET